jgi:UDP-glucose 4-epimerase
VARVTVTGVGRRVLVTGLGTFWGSRIAQAFEARDDVDLIVGVDGRAPRLPLTRTEFVKATRLCDLAARRARQVDTVLHAHPRSTTRAGSLMHETND